MTSAVYHSTFPTPAGPFCLAVDETGALVGAFFGEWSDLAPRLSDGPAQANDGRTRAAREQIGAYFRGERRDFDLPINPAGTAFQRRVWDALRAIPFGVTRSYGELAAALGSSARAVGGANGANPLCIVVPCHRVIGADGSLTGFAAGEAIKRILLEHEGALPRSLAYS